MTPRFASAFVLAAVVAVPAGAQDAAFTLPVERFRPASDDKGLATTEAGAIPAHLGVQTALLLNYALNPLILRDGAGNAQASIIAHRVAGDALFSIGLLDAVSLGVAVPVTLLQLGGEVPDNLAEAVGVANGLTSIGVGDVRLVPKVRVLREDRHIVSLAFIPSLSLPTAGGLTFTPTGAEYQYGGGYLGEGPGAFAFIPEVAVSTNLAGVRLAGNLAYRLRQPVRFLGVLEISPELVYRAGVGYDLSTLTTSMSGLMVFAELYGATADRNPFGLRRDGNANDTTKNIEDVQARLTNPLEWLAGARWWLGAGFALEAGVGTGLAAGYGSPDLRVFGGLRYAVEDTDRDDDDIADEVDACPDAPEDKDGHDDRDGCPDPDNDGDGVPDSAEQCPDQAEDKDGWQDSDGCPENDNDKDGVIDGEDNCPQQAGEPAYGGCPAPDRDNDGVADATDLCPDVHGKVELVGCPDKDNDGVEDEKDECPSDAGQKPSGCPDQDSDGVVDLFDLCPAQAGTAELNGCADTDKDGIADPDDKCPSEAEIINGVDDGDGCPDQGKMLVTITKDKIEIAETVFFDSGKATIQKRSFALLDQLALVMRAHPEVKKIVIEGHTDDQGVDARNLELSRKRAASVVSYLEGKSIGAERLSSDGFGESKPIESNKTKLGREKNRRVEIRILQQE